MATINIVPYDIYKKACYTFHESGIVPGPSELFVASNDGGYYNQPGGVYAMSVSWASSQYMKELTDREISEWYIDELLHVFEEAIDELSDWVNLIRECYVSQLPICLVSRAVEQLLHALDETIVEALHNIVEMKREVSKEE